MDAALPLNNDRHARVLFFVGAFLITLLVQGFLYATFPVYDLGVWGRETAFIARGEIPPLHSISPDFPDPVYIYPGTSLLFPASALMRLGISQEHAFRTSTAILLSLAIAGAIYVARALRPASIWWIAVGMLLIGSRHYIDATPPSSLATALAVLFVLLLLYVAERPHSAKPLLATLGTIGGILIATRLDIGSVIVGSALCYLAYTMRSRAIIPALCAALTFALLDPYFVMEPIAYVGRFLALVHQHYGLENGTLMSSAELFLETTPITLFAVALGTIMACAQPTLLSIPRRFFLWMLATSGLLFGLLYRSHFHPGWYFYPIFALWEIFFPLFLFDLFQRFPAEKARAYRLLVMGIIICMQALFLFIYVYYEFVVPGVR